MLTKETVKSAKASKSVNSILLGTFISMAIMSSPAVANDFSKPERVNVKINVADFNSTFGIEKIYSDLALAADNACSANTKYRLSEKFIQDCKSDLLEQFVADLDHSKLTEIHQAKT